MSHIFGSPTRLRWSQANLLRKCGRIKYTNTPIHNHNLSPSGRCCDVRITKGAPRCFFSIVWILWIVSNSKQCSPPPIAQCLWPLHRTTQLHPEISQVPYFIQNGMCDFRECFQIDIQSRRLRGPAGSPPQSNSYIQHPYIWFFLFLQILQLRILSILIYLFIHSFIYFYVFINLFISTIYFYLYM